VGDIVKKVGAGVGKHEVFCRVSQQGVPNEFPV
jgi:hypothetical protein